MTVMNPSFSQGSQDLSLAAGSNKSVRTSERFPGIGADVSNLPGNQIPGISQKDQQQKGSFPAIQLFLLSGKHPDKQE